MKCPACHRTLTAVTVSGVTVDVCRDGCAGMWFDQGELHWFDQPTQAAGQALVEITGNPKVSVDLSQRRRCPKCPNSVLMRHFFSAKRAVTVDECPTCAGMWLDAGELERIRAEYDSAEARRQAARAGFEEALVGDRMALMRTEIEEELPYDTSRSRVLASVVVVLNLLLAFKAGGAAATATRLTVSIVPWACVCFTEAMSTHIGPVLGVSRQSPRSWLWFFAWLVLLLPEIQLAILWARWLLRW
jgi:Zn-finger nucleic acid-binding protein